MEETTDTSMTDPADSGRRRKVLLVIGLVLVLSQVGPRWDADAGEAWIVGDGRPLIIAHGGGLDLFPANTMVAFDGSAAHGIDVLEIDLQLTADDHLVTMHDDTVDRTTNGSGKVRSMTLADVRALDASATFALSDGTNPWNGTHVPPVTIEEVLDRFAPSPLRFILEIKNGGPDGELAAEVLATAILERSMEARVVVGSFHVSSLEAFRAESGGSIATSGAEPEIRRCLLPGLVGLDRWWLDPGPVSILQIPTEGGGFNLATEGIVRRAHAHGQAVQYWTINDVETMEHLIEIGADGIMTDDVVRLRTVLIDAGYEAPAGWVA